MVKEAGISDKSNKGRKVVSAAGGMHAEEEKKGREIGLIISNLDKICLS